MSFSDRVRAAQNVDELLTLIAGDDSISLELDLLVHDAKSDEAAELNNGGAPRQVAYLVPHNYTVQELSTRIAEYLED